MKNYLFETETGYVFVQLPKQSKVIEAKTILKNEGFDEIHYEGVYTDYEAEMLGYDTL